jgi:putative SOS response-associated peptidase YedK
MCNDYRNHISYSAYVEAFSEIRIRIFAAGGPPNLEPRDDIWPTDPAPVIRAAAGGAELVTMRWGFPPARPKAGPIINFRSEGRRLAWGRCLIPADGFYEFTGAKAPKAKWLFTLAGAPWFCIAGLWRPGVGAEAPPTFTMLTTAPGPDVAPYHDRQVAVLGPADWAAWLDPDASVAPLLRPGPPGTLQARQVR